MPAHTNPDQIARPKSARLTKSGTCRGIAGRFAGVTLAAVCLAMPLSRAVAQSQGAPRVTLGSVTGLPGASLMMPLSFTPDPANPVRSFSVDIDYVSNSLTFEKAMRAITAELADTQIQRSVKENLTDKKGLKRTTLRLAVSMPGANASAGLPEGLLAYLVFQINPAAKPFSIKMTPTAISATPVAASAKKVAITAEPGTATIEDPDAVNRSLDPELAPDVTCFFFTH